MDSREEVIEKFYTEECICIECDSKLVVSANGHLTGNCSNPTCYYYSSKYVGGEVKVFPLHVMAKYIGRPNSGVEDGIVS